MKKFYFLLVALIATLTASAATVYFEQSAGWTEVNMYSWTGSTENAAYPGVKLTETVTANGKTYFKATTNFEMVIFSKVENKDWKAGGNLTVVDNGIYNEKGFTNTTWDGGSVAVANKVSLAGDFNNYTENKDGYKFTSTDNTNYTLSLASLSGQFKVVLNGNWYGNGETIVLGESYTLEDIAWSPNMTLKDGSASNVTLHFNADTKVFSITAQGTTPDPTPDDPTPSVSLNFKMHGNAFTGDSNWGGPRLEYKDGVYVYEGIAMYTGKEFGMEVYDANWNRNSNPNWYAVDATIAELGKEYAVKVSGSNAKFNLPDGNYTITFNDKDKTIKFEEYKGTVTDTYTWGIKGTIFNAEDNANNNWVEKAMTEQPNGTWTLTAKVYPGIFGIPYNKNSVQVKWYGPADQTSDLAIGNYTYHFTESGEKFEVTEEATVTITIDPETEMISFTGFSATAGIVAVEAEEAAAEYYNLQGVRVAQPTQGLYIVRQGNKVSKQVIR